MIDIFYLKIKIAIDNYLRGNNDEFKVSKT